MSDDYRVTATWHPIWGVRWFVVTPNGDSEGPFYTKWEADDLAARLTRRAASRRA